MQFAEDSKPYVSMFHNRSIHPPKSSTVGVEEPNEPSLNPTIEPLPNVFLKYMGRHLPQRLPNNLDAINHHRSKYDEDIPVEIEAKPLQVLPKQNSESKRSRQKIFDTPSKQEIIVSPFHDEPEDFGQQPVQTIQVEESVHPVVVENFSVHSIHAQERSVVLSVKAQEVSEHAMFNNALDQSSIKHVEGSPGKSISQIVDGSPLENSMQLQVPVNQQVNQSRTVQVRVLEPLMPLVQTIPIEQLVPADILEINQQLQLLNDKLRSDMTTQDPRLHTKPFQTLQKQCHTTTQLIIDTLDPDRIEHKISVKKKLFSSYAETLPQPETLYITNHLGKVIELSEQKHQLIINDLQSKEFQAYQEFYDMAERAHHHPSQIEGLYRKAQDVPREHWNDWLQQQ